jgi:predicted amidohydrolase YtcJ
MRTLYRSGRVRTLSFPPEGEWVLIDDRHVERVGSGDPPAADRTVDLPGATILPGFIDSHVHLTGTGVNAAGPDLGGVRSGRELLVLLGEQARSLRGPAMAHGFDETRWDDPAFPSISDLDAASGRPLIAVRTDGHVSLSNRRALEASGVLTIDGVDRDESGAPTGVVRREANWSLQRWFFEALPDHDVQQYQLQAAGLAASRGVTCVQEMAIPRSRGVRDFEVLMEHRERLPVDVIPFVASTDIPFVMDFGLPRIGGDLSLDGSIGARTALLSEPYADRHESGARYFDEDELVEFFHNAHLAGLQVAVHAIGDGAIEQSLRSWERVYGALDSRSRRHFRARRHRIEHFEMPTPGHVERAAMLGLAISVQPAFDARWGHPGALYEQRLGSERSATMNPFRTLLMRGMALGGGSDSPVTDIDPMAGITAAETHHDSGQRLSREEAIRLFTFGSAVVARVEEKKGMLEPGMQADFAAYEDDPLTALPLDDLRPVLTVSLGREVYAR